MAISFADIPDELLPNIAQYCFLEAIGCMSRLDKRCHEACKERLEKHKVEVLTGQTQRQRFDEMMICHYMFQDDELKTLKLLHHPEWPNAIGPFIILTIKHIFFRIITFFGRFVKPTFEWRLGVNDYLIWNITYKVLGFYISSDFRNKMLMDIEWNKQFHTFTTEFQTPTNDTILVIKNLAQPIVSATDHFAIKCDYEGIACYALKDRKGRYQIFHRDFLKKAFINLQSCN